ncbi:hypothetical protein IPH92_01890 [Candidatus Kaiserbacteria bacterium]|nr:MAG: hypothetical protein IPH92_01890 [Candidatus Kaiserbacteria bacterium]
MKNIITQIFVTLGALFLVLLCISVYFFIADPLNIKPLIFGDVSSEANGAKQEAPAQESTDTTTEGTQQSTGFTLSEAQKSALTSLGIDPAAVPSTISATQEACFVEALGASRVSEIKAGAVPNAIELLKAKPCIK